MNSHDSERSIVAKFGGWSTSTSERIKQSAGIMMEDPRRLYMVVSAPGIRFSGDAKISRLLAECWDLKRQGLSFQAPFTAVASRFEEIGADLGRKNEVVARNNSIFQGIEEGKGLWWTVIQGEVNTASTIAEFMGAEYVDAAEIIHFQQSGQLDPVSYELIKQRLTSSSTRKVIPGAYGYNTHSPDGIGEFGWGGSDTTGAVIAAGVNARLYENWTNTVLRRFDPALAPEASELTVITYNELRELVNGGAQVFHPDATLPVSERQIPTVIKNSYEPKEPGTLVVNERISSNAETVVAIAASAKDNSVTLVGQEIIRGAKKIQDLVPQILIGQGIKIGKISFGEASMTLQITNSEASQVALGLHNNLFNI